MYSLYTVYTVDMYIFIILYNDMILQKCVALVPKAPTANLEGPGTCNGLALGPRGKGPSAHQISIRENAAIQNFRKGDLFLVFPKCSWSVG